MKAGVMQFSSLALTVLLSSWAWSTADASTYTYSVNFLVPSSLSNGFAYADVTGTIVTDCDSCALKSSDFVSWSFDVAGTLNETFSGTAANVTGSNDPGPGALAASNSSVTPQATPNTTVFTFVTGKSVNDDLEFQGVTVLVAGACSNGAYCTTYNALSGPIATEIQSPHPATTPLPATLPLFVTGLGAVGLLGWRRKRKDQAVAA